MRALITSAAAAATLMSPPVLAQGLLENPNQGSIEAGISAVTGWHCSARQVELRIDGRSIGNAGTGTPRADTAAQCGRSDTGFSLLYNYALLRGGTHRIDAYADGLLFASASFTSTYLGAEFMSGMSSAHEIQDFPSKGQKARVAWSQSKQDFVVTGTSATLAGPLAGTYSVRFLSMSVLTGSAMQVVTSDQAGVDVSGIMTFASNGTYSMQLTLTVNGSAQPLNASGTYSDGGFYMIQDGAALALIERGETLTFEGMGPMTSVSPTSTGSMILSMARTGAKAEEAAPDSASGPMWPTLARALMAAALP